LLEDYAFESLSDIMRTGYTGHFEKFINYHYIAVALYIHMRAKKKSNLPKITYIRRWKSKTATLSSMLLGKGNSPMLACFQLTLLWNGFDLLQAQKVNLFEHIFGVICTYFLVPNTFKSNSFTITVTILNAMKRRRKLAKTEYSQEFFVIL
jgi:hypothetical protein